MRRHGKKVLFSDRKECAVLPKENERALQSEGCAEKHHQDVLERALHKHAEEQAAAAGEYPRQHAAAPHGQRPQPPAGPADGEPSVRAGGAQTQAESEAEAGEEQHPGAAGPARRGPAARGSRGQGLPHGGSQRGDQSGLQRKRQGRAWQGCPGSQRCRNDARPGRCPQAGSEKGAAAAWRDDGARSGSNGPRGWGAGPRRTGRQRSWRNGAPRAWRVCRAWQGSRPREGVGTPQRHQRTAGQSTGRLHVQNQGTPGCRAGRLHGPGRSRRQ